MGKMFRVESGGVGTIILYIIILSIVAMIALAVILNFFLTMPPPSSKIQLKYYIGGKEINEIVCTKYVGGDAYYDSSQYKNMAVQVLKNGKPVPNEWITISGCGITSETSKTNAHGFANFNIEKVHLPKGINSDKITVSVMGHHFDLKVVRG